MYGDLIEAMLDGLVGLAKGAIILVIVAIIATGTIAFFIGRGCAPTPESIRKQAERQAVIDTLTQEQRDALGIK